MPEQHDKAFEEEWFNINIAIPTAVVNGRTNLSEDQLKLMCYGFYNIGKQVILQQEIERLNKHLEDKAKLL